MKNGILPSAAVFIPLLLLIAFLVGTRDLSVGADSYNYSRFFLGIDYFRHSTRFEYGFTYLTYIISLITNSIEVYFALLFLLLTGVYCYFAVEIANIKWRFKEIAILIGFVLFSNWYISSSMNGLRQGLSLPIAYVSLLFLYRRKFISATVAALCAISFHISVMLIAPFAALVWIKNRALLGIFIGSSLLYATGLSKLILGSLSAGANISLYNDIIEYAEGADRWYGFQLNFFIYSVFWGVAAYFGRRFVRVEYLERYLLVWKFYCVLMLPYFFFAHGGYSNRYALMGWLLIPVLQTAFIIGWNIESRLKSLVAAIVLFVGVTKFVLVVNPPEFLLRIGVT